MTIRYALDVTRLFIGALRRTPRGIDRVEFEYAKHFFAPGRDDCVGVLAAPWGTRIFDAERVRRGLVLLADMWRETIDIEADTAWLQLLDILHRAQGGSPPAPAPPPLLDRIFGSGPIKLVQLGVVAQSYGESAAKQLPQGVVYLNVGQSGLAVPLFQRWLTKRPDLKSIFMLHDVIPITSPEFVSVREAKMHAVMVDQTARHAHGLIVTTAAAREPIVAELARCGKGDMPILTLPLPIPSVFSTYVTAAEERELLSKPYFVICGAIEPRKNHALLLNIWKEFVAEFGPLAPRLVIVGSPGWGSQSVIHSLRQNASLRQSVTLVAGLSSPAMMRLISGARALLMPSFAEGFGLPIVEAQTLGAPVVASDIGPHREIGGDTAIFLNPNDGPGWKAAILRLANEDAAHIERHPKPAPWSWDDYFLALSRFLDASV
ncbi:glycosyltransferase family 1 protein [Roseiarcaceae bacterium H3SJ34-1]|uniref:glycosyltransferase family 4 protein n=1 Tax=Terripilifer ovatus TaxID=3032367 RepID=UPI003AB94E64|nr:glycosyltransferase family 1 protein [Roseiarcaceae bacterium H3SJ34-1]